MHQLHFHKNICTKYVFRQYLNLEQFSLALHYNVKPVIVDVSFLCVNINHKEPRVVVDSTGRA